MKTRHCGFREQLAFEVFPDQQQLGAMTASSISKNLCPERCRDSNMAETTSTSTRRLRSCMKTCSYISGLMEMVEPLVFTRTTTLFQSDSMKANRPVFLQYLIYTLLLPGFEITQLLKPQHHTPVLLLVLLHLITAVIVLFFIARQYN